MIPYGGFRFFSQPLVWEPAGPETGKAARTMPAPCDCRPLSRKPVFSRNRAIRCNPASTVKPGSRSGRSHDTAYPPIDEIRRKKRQPAYVPVGNPPRPVFRKALADSLRQQRTLTMHLRTSPLPISGAWASDGKKTAIPPGRSVRKVSGRSS